MLKKKTFDQHAQVESLTDDRLVLRARRNMYECLAIFAFATIISAVVAFCLSDALRRGPLAIFAVMWKEKIVTGAVVAGTALVIGGLISASHITQITVARDGMARVCIRRTYRPCGIAPGAVEIGVKVFLPEIAFSSRAIQITKLRHVTRSCWMARYHSFATVHMADDKQQTEYVLQVYGREEGERVVAAVGKFLAAPIERETEAGCDDCRQNLS